MLSIIFINHQLSKFFLILQHSRSHHFNFQKLQFCFCTSIISFRCALKQHIQPASVFYALTSMLHNNNCSDIANNFCLRVFLRSAFFSAAVFKCSEESKIKCSCKLRKPLTIRGTTQRQIVPASNYSRALDRLALCNPFYMFFSSVFLSATNSFMLLQGTLKR